MSTDLKSFEREERARKKFHLNIPAKCPFLEEEEGISCGASVNDTVLGRDALVERCYSEEFDFCPIFLAGALSGGTKRAA